MESDMKYLFVFVYELVASRQNVGPKIILTSFHPLFLSSPFALIIYNMYEIPLVLVVLIIVIQRFRLHLKLSL
jgi:hypothetical protein